MPNREERDNFPFIERDNAPEFFLNGLHDVHLMGGNCRVIPYVQRIDGRFAPYREAPFTVIMPIDAVAPAMLLLVQRIPDIIIPKLQLAAKRLWVH